MPLVSLLPWFYFIFIQLSCNLFNTYPIEDIMIKYTLNNLTFVFSDLQFMSYRIVSVTEQWLSCCPFALAVASVSPLFCAFNNPIALKFSNDSHHLKRKTTMN